MAGLAKQTARNRRISKFNQRIRAMTPEQQDARAQAIYDRQWTKRAGDFGAAGQPAPLAHFGGPGTGRTAAVAPGPDGRREVQVDRPLEKELIYKGRYGQKRLGKAVLAHEFEHVYQNDPLFYEKRDLPHDQQPIEQDANAEGSRVAESLKERARRRAGKKQGLSAGTRGTTATTPDRSNVSSYYGRNPQTISYPGTASAGAEGKSGIAARTRARKRRAARRRGE